MKEFNKIKITPFISYLNFVLLRSCLNIPSVMFPQIVLKMNSSSRFLNALEMKT